VKALLQDVCFMMFYHQLDDVLRRCRVFLNFWHFNVPSGLRVTRTAPLRTQTLYVTGFAFTLIVWLCLAKRSGHI